MKRVHLLIGILFVILLHANEAKAAEPPGYEIRVDVANQLTYVYKLNDAGQYDLMDVWAASSGAPSTPTIKGSYTLKPLIYAGSGEWYYFKSWPCWVNYCTQISGNYCFHTPPMNIKGDYEKTPVSSLSQMMYAESHGCVRLLPRQAAFMWYNMSGCNVEIMSGEVTDETNALRDRLLAEMPVSAVNYPDPIITENTEYIYTYHNDSLEKLCALSGLTQEEIIKLNPDVDFTQVSQPGIAVRVKGSENLIDEPSDNLKDLEITENPDTAESQNPSEDETAENYEEDEKRGLNPFQVFKIEKPFNIIYP